MPRFHSILGLASAAVASLLLTGASVAQESGSHGMDHSGMETSGHDMAGGDHAMMMMPSTGNPDVNFARGMIPHHEGAIAMARDVIERGADPEIRRMAEEVIASQEAEIAFLNDWLAAQDEANSAK